MAEKQSILTPTGLLIWGDPYEPEKTDMQGNPLVVKSGPNIGQPRVNYAIGVAIPKTKAAWWDEVSIVKGQPYPWGMIPMNEALKGFPDGVTHQRRDFSWKIVDGDSTDFNQANPPKRFCDIPYYKGHWVIKFSSGFAPNIVNENGTAELTQVGQVYPGCYVQVFATVEGNRNPAKPGLYMNLQTISLQGYGTRISTGPDAATMGFGGGPLPAGASATPVGGMSLAQAQQTAMPQMPGAGAPVGLPQLPGAIALGVPSLPTPVAPLAVVPNAAFTTLPGVPQVPGVPSVPSVPVVPQRQLTPKAQGASYEQLISGGWTDDLLRSQGLMV